jgi:NitT/TauT family transport system ATP-binding protein
MKCPLDAQTRLILQNQLLELWHEERKTIIFITHDLGEAIALADRARHESNGSGGGLRHGRSIRIPWRSVTLA